MRMNKKAQWLRCQLESADCEVRIAATNQLSTLSDPSMELFVISLGDPDWRVRKAAVETFSQLDLPVTYISDLIGCLYHPENAGLRNSAIEILIGLGAQAVAGLQGEMSKPDVEVRKFVIDILGEIGDPRCATELINFLTDADINVRYAVVETLGKLKISAAVDPLLEMMSDPDPGLKFTILQSLSQIGGAIPTKRLFMFLEDRFLRKALFDCFAKVGGPEVIPPLVQGLSDPMRQAREAALCAVDALRTKEICAIKEALAATDIDQIATYLEQTLSDDKSQLKEAALALYGVVGATRDLSLLLSCIAEEGLRSTAISTFSELGEEPFARLINSLDAPDPSQLLHLVFVGGELGYSQALPLAIEASNSGDAQLRNVAARGLGVLGGDTEVELLQQMLDDEEPDVQDSAALAIANFAKRHKNIVLVNIPPLLSDSDPEKRMRVVRILGLVKGAEVEGQLLNAFKDSVISVRCEAIRALNGHFSGAVISGLTLALTDESAEVRRLAVSALSQCPQDNVLSALALASVDSDIWVRTSVMRALGLFSGETVLDLLLQGVADPVGLVAIAALESLVAVAAEKCQKFLEKALEHSDVEVVKAAMNQLSRFVGKGWIIPFGATLLNHPHWDVRLHAVRSIGQICEPEIALLLEERLAFETDVLVQQAIETAITGQPHPDSQGR